MTAMTPTVEPGRPVRVVLVGAGGIGAAHAQAAAGLDGVELVAVADVRTDAAESLAEAYGANAVDVDAATDPELADLAILATPPVTHPDLACALLHAGVAVMCEKPLTIDMDGARRLAACAEQSGSLLTMASKFRFVPDVVRTRSLLEAGSLGRVVKVEVAFAGQVDMTNRWNANPAIAGGGVLIDNGTHGVDVVRYLRGAITEVLVADAPRGQALSVEDSVVMLMRTFTGELAQVDVTWSYRRPAPTFVTVLGTEGTVEVGWRGSKLHANASPGPTEFGTGYDKVGSLRANLANVADAMRGVDVLRVRLGDALASVAVVDAAYRSMSSGTWEKVEVTP
jgi:predicted dehydrogenase